MNVIAQWKKKASNNHMLSPRQQSRHMDEKRRESTSVAGPEAKESTRARIGGIRIGPSECSWLEKKLTLDDTEIEKRANRTREN